MIKGVQSSGKLIKTFGALKNALKYPYCNKNLAKLRGVQQSKSLIIFSKAVCSNKKLSLIFVRTASSSNCSLSSKLIKIISLSSGIIILGFEFIEKKCE